MLLKNLKKKVTKHGDKNQTHDNKKNYNQERKKKAYFLKKKIKKKKLQKG